MSQARRKKTSDKHLDVPNFGRASSGFAMLLIGFFIGLITTTLYFGYRSDRPGDIGSGIRDLIDKSRQKPVATIEQPVVEDQAKDQVPTIESPTLDFYTVLPKIEQVIPEGIQLEGQAPPTPVAKLEKSEEKKQAEEKPISKEEKPAGKSYYMLQAASFRQAGEADRLKAKLALSGFQAKIQKVNVGSRGMFYRVQIGPFHDSTTLDSANNKLKGIGINAMRLKVSQGG